MGDILIDSVVIHKWSQPDSNPVFHLSASVDGECVALQRAHTLQFWSHGVGGFYSIHREIALGDNRVICSGWCFSRQHRHLYAICLQPSADNVDQPSACLLNVYHLHRPQIVHSVHVPELHRHLLSQAQATHKPNRLGLLFQMPPDGAQFSTDTLRQPAQSTAPGFYLTDVGALSDDTGRLLAAFVLPSATVLLVCMNCATDCTPNSSGGRGTVCWCVCCRIETHTSIVCSCYSLAHNVLFVGGQCGVSGQASVQGTAAYDGVCAWNLPHSLDDVGISAFKRASDTHTERGNTCGRSTLRGRHTISAALSAASRVLDTVWRFSVNSQLSLRHFRAAHCDRVHSIELSPDTQQRHLLSLHESGAITVWCVPSMRKLCHWPRNAAIHADTTSLISWWSSLQLCVAPSGRPFSVCALDTMRDALSGSVPPITLGRVHSMCPHLRCATDSACEDDNTSRAALVLEGVCACDSYASCQCGVSSIKCGHERANSVLSVRIAKCLLGYNLLATVLFCARALLNFRLPYKALGAAANDCSQSEILYRLVLLREISVSDLYSKHIESNDFERAECLARAYNLDRDRLLLRLWSTSDMSPRAIDMYLSQVKCRRLIVDQCLQCVPLHSFEHTRHLLNYGLGVVTDALADSCDNEEEEDRVSYTTARGRVRQYILRLYYWQQICALDTIFQIKDYLAFRDTCLYSFSVQLASCNKCLALSCLFSYYVYDFTPRQVMDILSCVPESVSVGLYGNMLPEVDQTSGRVRMSQHLYDSFGRIRTTLCSQEASLSYLNEIDVECPSATSPADMITASSLTAWYVSRATDILVRTDLVDNALELLRLGVEKHVDGLENLLYKLSAFSVLVYGTSMDSVTHVCDHMQDMSYVHYRQLSPSVVVNHVLSSINPDDLPHVLLAHYFANYVSANNCQSAFFDYIREASADSLALLVNYVSYNQAETTGTQCTRTLALQSRELLEFIVTCLIACRTLDTDASARCTDRVLSALSQQPHSCTLVDRIRSRLDVIAMCRRLHIHYSLGDLETIVGRLLNANVGDDEASAGANPSHPNVVTILEHYSRAYFHASPATIETGVTLSPGIRATHTTSIYQLYSDILHIRNTLGAFDIELLQCRLVVLQAMLLSSNCEIIELAGHLSRQQKLQDLCFDVSSDAFCEIIVSVAREYIDSATDAYSKDITTALQCLSQVENDTARQHTSIQCEQLFVECLKMLHALRIRMTPVKVRHLSHDQVKCLLDRCLGAQLGESRHVYREYERLYCVLACWHIERRWLHWRVVCHAVDATDIAFATRLCTRQLLCVTADCDCVDHWPVYVRLAAHAPTVGADTALRLLDRAVTLCDDCARLSQLLVERRHLHAQIVFARNRHNCDALVRRKSSDLGIVDGDFTALDVDVPSRFDTFFSGLHQMNNRSDVTLEANPYSDHCVDDRANRLWSMCRATAIESQRDVDNSADELVHTLAILLETDLYAAFALISRCIRFDFDTKRQPLFLSKHIDKLCSQMTANLNTEVWHYFINLYLSALCLTLCHCEDEQLTPQTLLLDDIQTVVNRADSQLQLGDRNHSHVTSRYTEHRHLFREHDTYSVLCELGASQHAADTDHILFIRDAAYRENCLLHTLSRSCQVRHINLVYLLAKRFELARAKLLCAHLSYLFVDVHATDLIAACLDRCQMYVEPLSKNDAHVICECLRSLFYSMDTTNLGCLIVYYETLAKFDPTHSSQSRHVEMLRHLCSHISQPIDYRHLIEPEAECLEHLLAQLEHITASDTLLYLLHNAAHLMGGSSHLAPVYETLFYLLSKHAAVVRAIHMEEEGCDSDGVLSHLRCLLPDGDSVCRASHHLIFNEHSARCPVELLLATIDRIERVAVGGATWDGAEQRHSTKHAIQTQFAVWRDFVESLDWNGALRTIAADVTERDTVSMRGWALSLYLSGGDCDSIGELQRCLVQTVASLEDVECVLAMMPFDHQVTVCALLASSLHSLLEVCASGDDGWLERATNVLQLAATVTDADNSTTTRAADDSAPNCAYSRQLCQQIVASTTACSRRGDDVYDDVTERLLCLQRQAAHLWPAHHHMFGLLIVHDTRVCLQQAPDAIHVTAAQLSCDQSRSQLFSALIDDCAAARDDLRAPTQQTRFACVCRLLSDAVWPDFAPQIYARSATNPYHLVAVLLSRNPHLSPGCDSHFLSAVEHALIRGHVGPDTLAQIVSALWATAECARLATHTALLSYAEQTLGLAARIIVQSHDGCVGQAGWTSDSALSAHVISKHLVCTICHLGDVGVSYVRDVIGHYLSQSACDDNCREIALSQLHACSCGACRLAASQLVASCRSTAGSVSASAVHTIRSAGEVARNVLNRLRK